MMASKLIHLTLIHDDGTEWCIFCGRSDDKLSELCEPRNPDIKLRGIEPAMAMAPTDRRPTKIKRGRRAFVLEQMIDEALTALTNWDIGPYERIHRAHLALGDSEHEWIGDEDDL